MSKIITPVAVIVCGLSVGFAQETDERINTLYDNLDKNGDGLLTRDEFDNNESEIRLFERFLQLYDKDEDNRLTKEEYLKAFEPSGLEAEDTETPVAPERASPQRGMDATAIFSRLDNNQDGKLELNELPRPLQERLGPTYRTLGKDSLTVEEFSPAFRALFAKRRKEAGLPSPDAFFDHFDQNQDGKVTLDEVPEQFRQTVQQMFQQLETEFLTKDGYTKIYELLVERSRPKDSQQPPDNPEERRQTARDDQRARPEFMGRPAGREAQRQAPSFFSLLDTDGDGKLSSSELSRAPQLVARLDRDRDDLLEPAELFGFGRERRNRDGRFGPDQSRPQRAERTDERPQRPQRPALAEETRDEPEVAPESPQTGTAPPRATRTSIRNASNAEFVDELFVRFDGNRDGELSGDEAPARLRQSFGRLDLDADGSVSKDELAKALERRGR